MQQIGDAADEKSVSRDREVPFSTVGTIMEEVQRESGVYKSVLTISILRE